jgi:drug/metabolite transporter (DMT)-like permease
LTPLFGPGVGALCALGSGFSWAVIGLVVRTFSPTFNSVTINAIRTLIGGVLIVILSVLTGEIWSLLSLSGRNIGFLIGSTILGFGIGDTLFFESSRRIGLARAMTVSTTYPLMSALLAAAILGERLSLRVAAGSLLALGGLALLAAREGSGTVPEEAFWAGFGLAMLACLSWAVSVILLKPPVVEVSPTAVQALRLPMAGVLLWATPWARGAFDEIHARSAPTLRRLGGLGALTATSSILFVAGVKYAGVSVGTVLSSTSPLFAIPLGLVFLGERPTPRALAGSVMSVVGIAVIQL